MRRLKKWIRNEPGLKLISLILAVILWFYISGEMTEEHAQTKVRLFKDIPVEVMGRLESFGTHVKIEPEIVDLEVGGPPEIMDNLSRDEIKAYIRVERLSPGKYMLPLQVVLPPDIVLISESQIIEVEVGVSDEK